MDPKIRKSVLRKSTATDSLSTEATPRLKRRISFSGKHLVREFQSEEEPKTWNNAYEVFDHQHVEMVSKICVSKKKSLRSAPKNQCNEKENLALAVSNDVSQTHKNDSITNNSVLSTISYKKYNIENSVDITIFERELKYRVAGADDHTKTNINSFSVAENEKDLKYIGLVERTVDFMQNDSKSTITNDLPLQEISNKREASMVVDCSKNDNVGGFTVYSEYLDGVQNMEVPCAENKCSNELATIYMNDSMSTSLNEQGITGTKKTTEKRKTIQRTLECSPSIAKLYDKENIMPTLKANETINKSCCMEIDVHCLEPKIKVNIDRESMEFHNKLDKLSFLRQTDDNMQSDITQTAEIGRDGAIPKLKSRPTINFNQHIEVSPVKDKLNSTMQTVYFIEDISENSTVTLKTNAARQTFYCDDDIRDVSHAKLITNPIRRTVNFLNEDINEDSPVKIKSNSPVKPKSNPSRETVHLNEDIGVTSVKLTQESTGAIRKNGQPLLVRKICTPLVNKCKTQVELEQQRMLRFKKKLDEGSLSVNVENKEMPNASNKAPNQSKLLNISLSSVKNLSLSPDSSSPLFPSEFKVYNLKQLNDELERGNLHVYSNAPKTPTTDRKIKAPSQFSKNLQCSESSKQRRTLIFEDADIPIAAADDTSTNVFKSTKLNDYFDFYTTQEAAIDWDKKKNAKCRYSQADDMMLDNTSFLTKAKLGDETSSRNSTKRDATQFNNIDILYDVSLMEAATQFGGDSCVKSIQGINGSSITPKPETTLNTQSVRESCLNIHSSEYYKNDNKRFTTHLNDDIELCDIFFNNNEKKLQNSKTQTDFEVDLNENRISVSHKNNMYIEDEGTRENTNRKIVDLNEGTEIDTKDIEPDKSKSLHEENLSEEILSRKTVCLNKDDFEHLETLVRNSSIFFGNDIPNANNENSGKRIWEQEQKHLRHTMHFDNENIDCEVEMQKTKRQTVYLDYDIENEQINDLNHKHFQNVNVDNNPEPTVIIADDSITDKEIFTTRCARNVDTDNKRGIKRQQTLHFYQDNDLERSDLASTEVCVNESISALCFNNSQKAHDESPQARKSICTAQCMDLTHENIQTVKNDTNDKQIKRRTLYINDEIGCEEAAADNNTLPEYNGQPLITSNMESTCPLIKTNRKTYYYYGNETNIGNESKSSMAERKTLHFDNNYDISIEESGTKAEYNKFPEGAAKPINAAKMSLLRHNPANTNKSLANKINSFNEMTPVRMESANRSRLNEMTPGLLEFIAEERKSQVEPNLERAKFSNSLCNEVTMKRSHGNLTPIVSMAKKRQTLVFDDCNMDETHTPRAHESSATKANIDINVSGINDTTQVIDVEQAMDISGIVSNESVIKQSRSHIPIPLGSGKKSLKNICPANDQVKNSTNYKEFRMKVDIEKDVEQEASFQMLRRATTVMQRRDLCTDPKGHAAELDVKQPSGQPSLFEDNPITISDVSVFFTSQRKGNSENTTVPIPDLTAAMDTINICERNAVEKNKRKSFKNSYINITCEDIDQTRLSLVRTLSDDDDDHDKSDNVNEIAIEYNDACYGQNPLTETVTETATATPTPATDTRQCNDNSSDSKVKRNVSALCRKCKRCQNTLLSETASSTADSFVLPTLPPSTDLGLDRLHRLRNCPTISDVHVLWQRLSFDRTIINPINISDDDCQLLSDAEDDISEIDESNPAIKALRKYYKERQEFERKLLESLQEKKRALVRQRPFVYRLEDLLSNNPNNWIFDYQKQVRGIYIFSHRKMLTFSLSLTIVEIDPLGIDISLETINLQKNHVPKKNWKAIDYILDFQLKLNLPYDLQSLCEDSNEAAIFKMLQVIDRICVDTVIMGQALQRVIFSNQASIIRDGCRTFVRKIIRKLVNETDNTAQQVEKTEIKIELLNLKKLSFKDIAAPPLHYFHEEIHLLPVGLQFLHEFLPNPLIYLKNSLASLKIHHLAMERTVVWWGLESLVPQIFSF